MPRIGWITHPSPVLVAATVLFLYLGWIGAARYTGHTARDFAFVGRDFVERSSASPAINTNKPFALPGTGYDGQFFLFIAQDPARARHYIDDPVYRYGRIGYPLAARAAALGRSDVVPATLVAVNLLAVALGTLAIAALLVRRGQPAWFALLFAGFPGVFIAVLRDLSEAMAYSLVALAILVFDAQRPRRLAVSAALFAVAILTRETTAVFALIWGGSLLIAARGRRERLSGIAFLLAAFVPYVAYRLFLIPWLGDTSVPTRVFPTAVPFGGIAAWWPPDPTWVREVYAVVLPGTLCFVLAVWALRRRVWDAGVVALAANALLYAVLLPAASFGDYNGSVRISTGIVLSLLLAAQALEGVYGASRTWLWVPVVAWFAPWWILLPTAFWW